MNNFFQYNRDVKLQKTIRILVYPNITYLKDLKKDSYVQAIKNITSTSVVTEVFGGVQSYGLKFWSLYGASNCGAQSNQKCVPDNNVITPVGFDGQYMLMDFVNKLIMIRFSLYAPVEQVSSDKKMIEAFPNASNFIVTAPLAATGSSPNPVVRYFPAANFWYNLNN